MGYSIIATARNEGPFILEWLAHHLSIGFEKIFVATNDCDDQTDHILKLIGRNWPVYHIENSGISPGETFQQNAVRKCLDHPALDDRGWVLHIDIDEFLNIDAERPDIADLMHSFEGADAVAVLWRTFGDNNKSHWDGGSVLDGFHRCQNDLRNTAEKTIFRRESFGDCTPHCPKMPQKPVENLRIVTTGNRTLDAAVTARRRGSCLTIPEELKTFDRACVNHYMHKSRDLVRLGRMLRGDANGRRNARHRRKVGTPEYEIFNRNDVVDFSIQANRDARIRIFDALIETPGVLEAHYAAQQWFNEQLLNLNREER